MNLPLYFARKYMFSKKISNVIHVISLVSLIGVTVGSFALIVVLSVFNGFEDVVVSLYNSFDSDFKVIPGKGKYFDPAKDVPGIKSKEEFLSQIEETGGVKKATLVIEENALVKYEKSQTIARLKAIEPSYLYSMGLDSMVVMGKAALKKDGAPAAILGAGIAGKIDMNYYSEWSPVNIYIPKKKKTGFVMDPRRAFHRKRITPGGIFSIQQDFDEKYILVPLDFIRPLVEEKTGVTAVEINLTPGTSPGEVREKIEMLMGEGFEVRDRFQQHAWLYQIMRSEKMAVYAILTFILLIAAFNLTGALLMVAIEKKKDLAILKGMGASGRVIRNIIFFQGILLSSMGAFLGIGLGTVVCWLQIKFGWVKITQGSTFVLSTYPVNFHLNDFIMVFITVVILGLIASYYPAHIAYRQLSVKDLHR